MTEICVRFCRSLDLLERFADKSAIWNFTEILPMGEALTHADIRMNMWKEEETVGRTDGRMDMTKLIGALCDYENANKKNDKGYRDIKENKIVEGNLETWSPSNHTMGETTFVASMTAENGWWRAACGTSLDSETCCELPVLR